MRKLSLAILASLAVVMPSVPSEARKAGLPLRPDLADTVQGSYYGDVISDSRGSSHPGVTLTVTRTGSNTVTVTSSYARLPAFTVGLTRAMQTIQQASGNTVFLVDQSKTPWSLDVTVDGASWSGVKQ